MSNHSEEIERYSVLIQRKEDELRDLVRAAEFAAAERQILEAEVHGETTNLQARLGGGYNPQRPPHLIALRIANHQAAIALLNGEEARLRELAVDITRQLGHARAEAARYKSLDERAE